MKGRRFIFSFVIEYLPEVNFIPNEFCESVILKSRRATLS